MVEAALQSAYPNSRLQPTETAVGCPPVVLRVKKHADFIKRVSTPERFQDEREPTVNRLLTAMGACGEPAFVQIAMTPTPALFEAFAKRRYKHHETRLSRDRREHLFVRDRSLVCSSEAVPSAPRPPAGSQSCAVPPRSDAAASTTWAAGKRARTSRARSGFASMVTTRSASLSSRAVHGPYHAPTSTAVPPRGAQASTQASSASIRG